MSFSELALCGVKRFRKAGVAVQTLGGGGRQVGSATVWRGRGRGKSGGAGGVAGGRGGGGPVKGAGDMGAGGGVLGVCGAEAGGDLAVTKSEKIGHSQRGVCGVRRH